MDEILETILKLYGKPGIDTSYLPKLIRNHSARAARTAKKVTGEVRRGYGEPDSSLEEVCWEFKGEMRAVTRDVGRLPESQSCPNLRYQNPE